jgi:hypothetical protein
MQRSLQSVKGIKLQVLLKAKIEILDQKIKVRNGCIDEAFKLVKEGVFLREHCGQLGVRFKSYVVYLEAQKSQCVKILEQVTENETWVVKVGSSIIKSLSGVGSVC